MNNELIKIKEENGQKLVSARELHEFLESKERFSKWWNKVSDKEDYGFEENVDYTPYQMVHPSNQQEITDYIVTIEMAKEISMISKLPKGKEARKYFISCEKQLQEVQTKASLLLEIYNGGQSGILASKKLTEIEVKEATAPLLEAIEEQKPMVEFTETILKSSDNILVRQLSKIAQEQGMNIGEKKLYKKLREWGYVLDGGTEPTQRAMNQNLFVVEEKPYRTAYGSVKLSRTTLVTPKGQIFIIEKLRKEMCVVKQ